jgi:hypothetical protein
MNAITAVAAARLDMVIIEFFLLVGAHVGAQLLANGAAASRVLSSARR